ncbi:Arc family DNA-binding protein [Acinetobacter baumannii]|nr:Arc family DNA-binding protein [Acinetobacter baumannii]MDC5524597.1 Arc family DNA-binding protein [Acinetobacter baumannii]MDC5640830.1 Arc family DNA-binding protein [Acinetobacter baumannii]MDC5675389.1 Arc family DNA-binding protein [Acinetobacter baumannii]MDC5686088.1 Arc family DNA-binding protein [Acinetobacter baumannii]
MSKHKHPQYNLRLPQDLKFFLAEQAKKDGRSLNNFIVKTLEETRCKLLTQIN